MIRWRKAFVAAAVLACFFFLAAYTIAFNSEPYQAARTYLTSHQMLTERIGTVTSVRLGFGRMGASYSELSGSARFPLVAKTAFGSTKVSVQMRKELGKWVIVEAKAHLPDGSTVDLAQ